MNNLKAKGRPADGGRSAFGGVGLLGEFNKKKRAFV